MSCVCLVSLRIIIPNGKVTKVPRPLVTQASLSLDNSVETLLLRNEGDFISVETTGKHSHTHHHQQQQGQENCCGGISSARKTRKQRDDNMRQLLDVTNKFTNEEIRDFEMR